MQFYESLGIGPWQPFSSLEPFRHELLVKDTDAFMRLKYFYTQLGDIQLQLCEPTNSQSDQGAFLQQHGPGVFHIGFTVDNVDTAEIQGHKHHLNTLIHGRLPDRSGFTYFDTRAQAGVILQIRQSLLK